MAPPLAFPSLSSLSQKVVTSGLTAAFKKLKISEADKIDELKNYYNLLPVIVSDELVGDLLDESRI